MGDRPLLGRGSHLWHHADDGSQRVQLEVTNVFSVHANTAILHVKEAEQQAQKRALATPRAPHNRNGSPGGHVHGKSVKDPVVAVVPERHVLELEGIAAVLTLGQLHRVRPVLHFRRDILQREHGLHVDQGLSDFAVDGADEIEWEGELEQEPVDQHQVPHSHGAWAERDA